MIHTSGRFLVFLIILSHLRTSRPFSTKVMYILCAIDNPLTLLLSLLFWNYLASPIHFWKFNTITCTHSFCFVLLSHFIILVVIVCHFVCMCIVLRIVNLAHPLEKCILRFPVCRLKFMGVNTSCTVHTCVRERSPNENNATGGLIYEMKWKTKVRSGEHELRTVLYYHMYLPFHFFPIFYDFPFVLSDVNYLYTGS